MIENDNKMLNIGEVAEYLRVSTKEVYKLCKRKSFPAVKIANSWRIPKQALDDWIIKQLKKK